MIFNDKRHLIGSLPIEVHTTVLDVGFTGQAVKRDSGVWPHALLQQKSDHVYGVDIELDTKQFPPPRYQQASAEGFSFEDVKFDYIFAGDLIEHLSNPGLFLQTCKKHLKPDGVLVLTTPNAFNLLNIIEKVTHDEPGCNPDHTCYFNKTTIVQLLKKNGFSDIEVSYLYTLGTLWKGGWKRKIVASIYWFLSKVTPKYLENIVVFARN